MSQERINKLRQELNALEAEQLKQKSDALWSRVKDLCREDMQRLRDLLNVRIRETYDGDDE